MPATTVREYMDRIADVDPSRIESVDGVFLFDLSGEGGGKWAVIVKEGQVEIEEDGTTPADVTIAMTTPDFIALSNGQLNPVAAFMQGKIKVSGNMALAMQMQSLLT